MNKISALLLVTAVIVSTGAIAGHGYGHDKDRMHEYWNMKMDQWNTAINEQNAKTQAEAKKLLKQVEAKHDAMVAEFKKIDSEKIKSLRREKHALMNKLDKTLGLKTKKFKARVKTIKTGVQNKMMELEQEKMKQEKKMLDRERKNVEQPGMGVRG